MANYYSYTRTNYFKIKDEDTFKSLTSKLVDVYGGEIYSEVSEKCGNKYGFLYGENINFKAYEEEGEDPEFDLGVFFASMMSLVIADDDAMIWTTIGREKMRYLVGFTCIVTSSGMTSIDLTDISLKKAKEMLKNDSWETQNSY